VHEGNAGAQLTQAIANVETALVKLGAALTDVVRTRLFVTDITRWPEIGEAHKAAFGDVMPATTMVQVAALIDPRLLVEIEAVAYKPGAGTVTAMAGETDSGADNRPAAAPGLGWP